VVGDVLMRLVHRYPPLDLSRPTGAQAVVILGGGSVRFAPEYSGPAAALDTLDRLNYGAFVARRTALPVLVSGSPAEAHTMRITLSRDFGIEARWVENQSGDTFENARFSARLLRADHIHRIVLVTSSSHEWRAAHEFMEAGFDVVPAPVGTRAPRSHEALDYLPTPGGLLRSYSALYELLGEPAREVMAALHLRRQDAQGQEPAGPVAKAPG
jgi:uncharacterized SAM-binding protein YcdF (DUF218 family)